MHFMYKNENTILFKCYIFHSTSITHNPESQDAYITFREVVPMSNQQGENKIIVAFW